MNYSDYLDSVFLSDSKLGKKMMERVQTDQSIAEYWRGNGNALSSFDKALEICSIQLATRLNRIRFGGCNTLSYEELSELLDFACPSTLQRWASRKHFPCKAAFLLADKNLKDLEELLKLEPLDQINPWERHADS